MAEANKKKKIFDNRYEILSIVGRGKRSVVYHARYVDGEQEEVALKVILQDKDGIPPSDLLRKEALAMVSSRHKYVIRLDDFHSLGEICYLTMEYAPLGDLRKYLSTRNGKLSPTQVELFLLQAGEALDFIHKAGILHRDLKPENILVIDDQNIRMGDFGVAILPGEKFSLEELQKGIGTLDYLSPEVLEGTQYDKRSDLYALGVTFYELLSGQHPFSKASLIDQVDIRKNGAFTKIHDLEPDAPAHLLSAIHRLMNFEPEQRFQSARSLIQALISFEVSDPDSPTSTPHQQTIAPHPAAQITEPTQSTTGQPIPRRPLRAAEAAAREAEALKAQEEQKLIEEQKTIEHNPTPPTIEEITDPNTDPTLNASEAQTTSSPQEAEEIPELFSDEDDDFFFDEEDSEITETDTPPQNDSLGIEEAPAESSPISSLDEELRALDEENNNLLGQHSEVSSSESINLDINKNSAHTDDTLIGDKDFTQNLQDTTTAQAPGMQPEGQIEQNYQEEISNQAQQAMQQQAMQQQAMQQQYNPHEQAQINQQSHLQREPSLDKPQRAPSSRSNKTLQSTKNWLYLGLSALGLLFLAWYFLTGNGGPQKPDPQDKFVEETTHSQTSNELLLPSTPPETLSSFPHLAGGIYSGLAELGDGGETTPFTIISLESSSQLIFSLGKHGFLPLTIDISDLSEGDAIRIASQGKHFIITGEVEDDTLFGSLEDEGSGEIINWQVTP